MAQGVVLCPHCGHHSEYDKFHAGFGNQGYMYCDSDCTLVTWSAFDSRFVRLVGSKHSWMLNNDERKLVEESILDCPCGGRFTFNSNPRCPKCNCELPQTPSDSIYFLILGMRIDGEKQSVWK